MFTIAFFTTCRSFLSTFLVLPICYSRDMIEIFPSIFEINYNDTIDFKVERFVKEIKSANILKPFVPSAPFLYLTVFWCFRVVEKGCIENKWVKIEDHSLLKWNTPFTREPILSLGWNKQKSTESNFISKFIFMKILRYIDLC